MKIRVVIDSRVRVYVPEDHLLRRQIQQLFTHENTHRENLRRMNVNGWWAEPEFYVTYRDESDGSISLPRGGLSKVASEARRLGEKLRFEDKRCEGTPCDMPDHDIVLRDYQDIAVHKLLERQNALLRAPTASGKTSIGIACASRAGLRTLFVVPNTALMEQWIQRASKELNLPRSKIGVIKGGKYKVGPVTVGIAASVARHAKNKSFAEQFGMIVCDEVSLFAARTFQEAIDPMPAKYRFGISADQKRKDKKEFLIYDLFDVVACDLKTKDLVASGHVMDVTVKVIPTEFRADWYGSAMEGGELDFMRLITEIASDRERNRLIVEETRKAASQMSCVVFAHTREHCQTIEQTISGMGTRTGLLIGGPDYLDEFRNTRDGLESGGLRVGVGTYKAIALGIDIPRLGCGVCATPIASNKQMFQQTRGRICRTSTGKVYAELIYFLDYHVFPTHLKNIAAWNSTTLVKIDERWLPAREVLQRKLLAS